ncbi:MAG: hypothetical protein HDQ87_06545 [Clostridia bacterium]|nr:hypothetical protein [Clostridia bacterium]
MKTLKRIWLSVIAAAVLASAGCSTTPSTVAVVNDVAITGEQYQRALNGFLSNYGLTDESLSTTLGLAEAVDYKNGVIDELVLQELMLQYAGENGLDQISDAESEEIDNKVSSYLENLRASFSADVESEGTLQGDAASKEAEQRYKDYVDTYAYTSENLREQFRRQLILDRVYDEVMSGCSVSEAEVQAYYSEAVTSQREAEQEDPDAVYEDYLERVAASDIIIYVPEKAEQEARYVKHILVQIPSDVAAEISEQEASGNEEQAEDLRSEAMAELRQKASEILQEARAGADFDALVARYNEDPGVAYNPDGYMVYEGAAFDSAFLEDALSLEKVGDISREPVESGNGYHIIKFAAVPQAGAVPYSQVSKEIHDELQETKRKEYWSDAVAAWQEAAVIDKHEFRSE